MMVPLLAQPIPNTIYVVIDGLSYATFTSALSYYDLPAFQECLKRGHIYHNRIQSHRPAATLGYLTLLTGYSDPSRLTPENGHHPTVRGRSLVSKLAAAHKNLKIFFYSAGRPLSQQPALIQQLFEDIDDGSTVSYQAGTRLLNHPEDDVMQLLADTGAPFFLVMSFSKIKQLGPMIRVEGQPFGQAIRAIDTVLLQVINLLRSRNLWNQCHFFLTTDAGLLPGNRLKYDYRSWLMSDYRLDPDGWQRDIVPTILETYAVRSKKLVPEMLGRNLLKSVR